MHPILFFKLLFICITFDAFRFLSFYVIIIVLCFVVRYDLREVIVGRIYFLLVRLKVSLMELQIIKKEIVGIGMLIVNTEILMLICMK